MFLAVDIGNTNINFGIFQKDTLVQTYKVNTPHNTENLFEKFKILSNYNINSCIVASVVSGLDEIVADTLNKMFGIKTLLLTNNINLEIKFDVSVPSKVGADRIANACAAYKLYGKNSVVIDAGSAITFDTVKNGTFIGGIIMPGLNMQLKSLNTNTSKLPKINIEPVDNLIGKDTKNSILSGVVRGTACAVDGLLQKFKQELGEDIVVIGTGGDVEFLSYYMNNKFDYIHPHLTLEGLRFIQKMNIISDVNY